MPDGLDVFFFGRTEAPKLGCFHLPEGGAPRRTAIVLCPPLGHEAIRAHRAYRRLAGELAALGYPVFRFDLTGTGDSAGGEESWGLERWTGDVADALDEALRRIPGASAVCLAGGRLGAALALRAAAGRTDVTALVLWDPVLSGRDYLAELLEEHRRVLDTAHVTARERGPGEVAGGAEILGFEFSESLRRELEELRVAPPEGASPAVLTVRTESFPGSETPWRWMEDVARAVLPVRAVGEITRWIAERCA
jgi:pimeloyl-ACP methyl ester carboxylesterase